MDELKQVNINIRNKLNENETEAKNVLKHLGDEITVEITKIEDTHKEEKKSIINEYKTYKKEQEIKFKTIKEEKDNILEDLVKIQTEKDILVEKLQSLEKFTKIQESTYKNTPKETNNKDIYVVDECINHINCQGNCEAVEESNKLLEMKNTGGKRSCPQTETEKDRPMFKCLQCDFLSMNKMYFNEHMNKKHGDLPKCPFCQVGFTSLDVLKKHITVNHKEPEDIPVKKDTSFKCAKCSFMSIHIAEFTEHSNKNHEDSPNCPFCLVNFGDLNDLRKHIECDHKEKETVAVNKKGLCSFFRSRSGCKKGTSCSYEHVQAVNATPVTKVPKLCDNKEACVWKPSCRYIHPEDGEFLPVRSTRRQSTAKLCFYPNNCPRGGPGICSYIHLPSPINQGFTLTDTSQLPPGYRLYPIHQRYIGAPDLQQRGWVSTNIHSAQDFPHLRESLKHLTI